MAWFQGEIKKQAGVDSEVNPFFARATNITTNPWIMSSKVASCLPPSFFLQVLHGHYGYFRFSWTRLHDFGIILRRMWIFVILTLSPGTSEGILFWECFLPVYYEVFFDCTEEISFLLIFHVEKCHQKLLKPRLSVWNVKKDNQIKFSKLLTQQ